ncbi:MAG: signal transduction histidine kinase/DNA-binding response OmpR family regulator [Marinoscillum sp.]|jgi:signal transduction histidine kinase/DNA-binding response OmpR family regulator
MSKITPSINDHYFHLKCLVIVAGALLLLNPYIASGQPHTYQLSAETDSVVHLLFKDLTAIESVKILDNLKNEKATNNIRMLEDQLIKAKGDERLEMALSERLGRESKWVGNISKSYQYNTRTLYLAEKLKDNKTIANACFEIANNIRLGYVIDRPYEPYFNRAIEIFETLNDPLSQSHLLYAKLLLEEDNKIRLAYAEKAIEILKAKLNRSDTLMMESLARHLNVAGLYREGELAMNTFREGLSVAKEVGNHTLQAYILNNMGYEFLIKQEYDKAIPYHLEALDISMLGGLKGLASNSFNNLSVCYRNKGMHKEALDFFHCFLYIQSDINTNKYYQNLAEVQVTHEVDRFELKNELLLSEQKLQGRQRLILIITLFFLLLIIIFIFWSRKRITKTNEKLIALDNVKSRFFANISHELRTPITLINGPIEAMINGTHGEVSPGLKNQLMVVKNNGRNLLNLINEILDLTKLEAGKLKLVENPLKLFPFLNELLGAYQSEINDRKINFRFYYNYEKDATISVDEVKIAKIINNLLSNAFKFTSEAGEIVLSVGKINDQISISVKDSGQGIHQDDIQHVFERFYQTGQLQSKASGGTGIGLALSQELAKLHHGLITVNSVLGNGSEFTFSFPLTEAQSRTVEVEEEFNVGLVETSLDQVIERYVGAFEVERPVLLLTEDHKEMREFIASIVRPFFEVLEAENGLEALDLLQVHRVDMIVSDVMMPKMDGFELLEKIKGDKRLMNISMIMLTARAAEEDKLFALTLGVDDYLTKPFSREELLVRSKNILANRIIRKLENIQPSLDTEEFNGTSSELINRSKEIIEMHLSDNLLTVLFLASELSMSERQLLRKMKLITGLTPIQFIKEIRLQKAKQLFESQQIESVAQAAYEVGFEKVQYFSEQYIKRFGKRPSDLLNR